MQIDEPVPDYLLSLYNVLVCAFPDGVPDEEYWPLVAVLHSWMSFWTIADVISVLTHKHRSEVYNDASGFGADPPPPADKIEAVKLRLKACGLSSVTEAV